MTLTTAAELVSELRASADPEAHPNRHYHGNGDVLGVRMGQLFDIAKRATDLPLVEVDRLLDEPAYEPRLAAFCVLDFAVRRRAVTDPERADRYRVYLDRHDRIDSWDMVDRAAPRVVGEYLRDRPRDPLFELAASPDPLCRRTAITAPLIYTRRMPAASRISSRSPSCCSPIATRSCRNRSLRRSNTPVAPLPTR